jgi:Asp/Glu/hydantoin racemase
MRLRVITPIHVTPEELDRRQERYRRLAPPGITLEVSNLPDHPEVPRRLDSRDDIVASESFVYSEGMRTDPRVYDGIFLDCVLDPALEPLRAESGLAVFGPLRLTLGLLSGLGWRFAGVCRNEAIARALEERIRSYGYGSLLAGVEVLSLDFAAVSDNTVWNAAMQGVLDALEARGEVQALVNGCSAVDCTASRGGMVKVIDPVAVSLAMIATAYATPTTRAPVKHDSCP